MDEKRVSLSNVILLILEKAVEGGELMLDAINDLSYMRRGYGVYHLYPRPVSVPALSQAIRRLRQKGFVKHHKAIKNNNKNTGKIVLALTEKGREYLMLIKDETEITWDGKWRIVVFDIPENHRLVRRVLRSRLKLWGFVQWQKSVWASKKPVTAKLRELIKELNIEDWVLVFESDSVGRM